MKTNTEIHETGVNGWAKVIGVALLTAVFMMPSNVMSQQAPVVLNSVRNFVIFAGSFITSIPTSAVIGNVGLIPTTGAAITGLTAGEVTGTIYTVDAFGPTGSVEDEDLLIAAKNDLTAAYNDAASRTPEDVLNPGSGDIGGLTLAPGLYKFSSTAAITGSVTFDAGGDENAVFIMQIGSTLTTAVSSQVILAGNAKARNIFWQVGSSATLGVNSIFKGTIMDDQSITMNTTSDVEGRLLAINAAVSIDEGSITKPVSSSGIEDDQTSPKEFALLQNYPNPFNPSTLIRYVIEKDSQVSMKVFDTLGQEVATLVDGHQEAGKHSVQFNTENGEKGLSAGVYFYRLKAGTFVSMKKMMLIK
jgi:hypothetical protein